MKSRPIPHCRTPAKIDTWDEHFDVHLHLPREFDTANFPSMDIVTGLIAIQCRVL